MCFSELTQVGIFAQHLFEDLKGRGQTEDEMYRLSTGKVKRFPVLLPYVVELDFGEQRKHFNDMYAGFSQCLDDLYDAWAGRDRGIFTWVNQQADPPVAVAARWSEIAELGRNIDDGPSEMLLSGNALILKVTMVKYRWERLKRLLFKRPTRANPRSQVPDDTPSEGQ